MTADEWEETERRIVGRWRTGRLIDAFDQIDGVLVRGDDEQRGRALLYRGSIHEEADDLERAKDDFVQAVGLLPPGSYARYTAELSAGQASAALGNADEAVKWYRQSLLTCAHAIELISGHTALKALLALVPTLPPSDLQLARTVASKSWTVLELSGEPNLEDLASTIEILHGRASDPTT
jgi:tetratricopeptide (TPR) repeat protein